VPHSVPHFDVHKGKMKTAIILSALILITTLGLAEIVSLKDQSGRELRAELLSLKKDQLEVKREDGLNFTLSLKALSGESRSLVQDWALNNVPKDSIKIHFRDKSERKYDKDSNSRKNEIDVIRATFRIEYSHDIPLKNVKLEYKIIYEEERIGRPEDEFNQEKVHYGKITIPHLDSGKEDYTVSSPETIELWESSMKGSYSPNSGSSGPAEDEITGVWIRLFIDQIMIYETTTPNRLLERETWDAVK
jgi:hypothetical protein